MSTARPIEITRDGAVLRGEEDGDPQGPAVVLLHGLTATRRYVVHGSRALQKAGCRVVAMDARGHGESGPAPARDAYGYPEQARDVLAVMDALGIERATLAGHSMGAATAVAVALAAPERVAALALFAPAHLGRPSDDLARWDALAEGLERAGIEGFMAAPGQPRPSERWARIVETVTRQRLARHRDLRAVADALRSVPRSAAFDGLEALERVQAPALVVGSRDEPDPGHPLAVAEEWARRIPGAEFAVEEPGESPLPWRGAALSELVLDLIDRRAG